MPLGKENVTQEDPKERERILAPLREMRGPQRNLQELAGRISSDQQLKRLKGNERRGKITEKVLVVLKEELVSYQRSNERDPNAFRQQIPDMEKIITAYEEGTVGADDIFREAGVTIVVEEDQQHKGFFGRFRR